MFKTNSSLGLISSLRTLDGLRVALVMAAFALVCASQPAQAQEPENSAQVTILEGTAWRVPAKGEKSALAVDARVFEGDTLESDPGARLQVSFKDGSVIRLGSSSKLLLKSAYFGKQGEKNVNAKLLFGRAWSKVVGLVGGESKFEVETDNAVAGVRGTTFRVDASRDRSVLVRVYAGAVAVAPGALIPVTAAAASKLPEKAGTRRQVDGPKEVSVEQWEELVGKMMQMAVNADGTPGKPVAFTEADDAGDEWALWNKLLDED